MPLADAVSFINQILRDAGIKHLYMGGVAASAHGEPRATKDADIVILIDPADVSKLLDTIEKEGLPIRNRARVQQKLQNGLPAKIVWDKKFSFDLRLASYAIDGHALSRTQDLALEAFGETMSIATPEDVIVYKLARFDDIDKRDIRKMIEVQDSIDWSYVETNTEELSKEVNRPEMMNFLRQIRSWKR